MKKLTCHFRKFHLWALAGSLSAMLLALFLIPSAQKLTLSGDNMFHVSLNGVQVGDVGSREEAEECLRQARRTLAQSSEELIFTEADLSFEGEEVLWGRTTPEEEVVQKMISALSGREQLTQERCYTVKIADFIINLHTKEDVLSFLKETLRTYDPDGLFVVNLEADPDREITVLTPRVVSAKEQEAITQLEEREEYLPSAGIQTVFNNFFSSLLPSVATDFEDYELGLQELSFREKVEVVESYMPVSQISSVEEAVEAVTKEQETSQIHEVVSGDTLSGIASQYGLSMDALIAMNPILENENTVIHIGDNITVTVPEPELTVLSTEREYYEEDYFADVIYKDNDSWYTNHQETIQEAGAGHRRVIADVGYANHTVSFRNIIKEETTVTAIPKIIERGTKTPPTYIWPASGGSISSGFGGRKAPKAGASTNHKGIDIAVPTGTAVLASCGGTVTVAGWQSGYGYVVYLRHEDGRETRYGHLSKVLVSVGQSVTQGQRIALSGNTGNSTGPHLHFEIRIGGTAVNPLNYMN